MTGPLLTLVLSLLTPCASALDALEHAADLPRAHACAQVTFQALRQGVSVPLAVRLAYTESKLDSSVVSRAGAVGVLQVIPRYWCPSGCDRVEAGVRALRTYLHKHRRPVAAIAHYNGGNTPPPRSWRYARHVVDGVWSAF